MVRYVVLLNFSKKGLAEIKESPARVEAFRKAAAARGAEVEVVYWTLGSFDGVFVLSAPDDATAAALCLELGTGKRVRTSMLRAFDAEAFDSIIGTMG